MGSMGVENIDGVMYVRGFRCCARWKVECMLIVVGEGLCFSRLF